MTCLEFRRTRWTGPQADLGAFSLHLRGCPDCAKFARELERLDGGIEAAARIAPPAQLVERILLDHGLRSRRQMLRMAAAAALGTVAVAGGFALWSRDEAAAAIAIDHVLSEPDALRAEETVPAAQVTAAFASWGGRLKGSIGRVTHCTVCAVPQGLAHHMVVDTGGGRATVMLLPPYRSSHRARETRDGLVAIAAPVGRGVLAIVAAHAQTVAEVERSIRRHVAWG